MALDVSEQKLILGVQVADLILEAGDLCLQQVLLFDRACTQDFILRLKLNVLRFGLIE